MLPPYLYWMLLLAVTAYAFLRGAMDERVVSMTCLIGTIATITLSRATATKYSDLESAVLVVDLIAFGIFAGVALTSSRFWPLWVAGFQLSSTLAHFLRALGADMVPQVYAAAERFWIYPIFLAITVGVWRVRKYERPPRQHFVG